MATVDPVYQFMVYVMRFYPRALRRGPTVPHGILFIIYRRVRTREGCRTRTTHTRDGRLFDYTAV